MRIIGRSSVRFGPFEADLATGEIRRGSIRRHLVGQPFEILVLLLERPGELVTREEIRSRLWPDGTFVDFEHGLNAAVNKLRNALGDSAVRPIYVETIPRRGYRFTAPVDSGESAPEQSARRPAVKQGAGPLLLAAAFGLAVAAASLALVERPQRERPGARSAEMPGDRVPERLTTTERSGRGRAPTDSEAVTAYRRGRFYQRKGESWANKKAIESLRDAVHRDAESPQAWAALAEAEVFETPSREAMPRAKEAALRAITLAPRLAEAHAALGLALTYGDHDFPSAEASFRRALALDPRCVEAHYRFALLLGVLGRFDEALEHGRRAAELDPFSATIQADLGRIHYFARRFGEAESALKAALELEPEHYWALTFLGSVYDAQRRTSEAMKTRDRLLLKGTPACASPARRLVRQGALDEAIASLEGTFSSRGRDVLYLKVDPAFDPLRQDPRFDAVLRRVGF